MPSSDSPRISKTAWLAAGALVLLVAAGVVLLLANSSSSGESVSFTGSGYPNVDKSNTRHVGGPIDSSTVSDLEIAWTLAATGKGTFGSYASSPVVSKGVVYSQDLASNVQAINLDTGEVLWTQTYETPTLGPNGVVVADGRVYGVTATEAFALDQETGEEIWSVILTRNESEGIDIAPGYHDGLVYVSTVPTTASGAYAGEGVGVLWALDGKTGRKVWRFNTVPEDLWSAKNTEINSGGGLWYTPAFDGRGYMYFGVGNPAPFPGTEEYPWGSSRPGPNLYTNSVVKLDAKTGKMQWHYQLTPHDIHDWDLQGPAILMKVGGRELVMAAGKSGIVLALDRETGEVVWKRPVGTHNGHDDDGLYAMRGEYSKLKTPMTVYPGAPGGVIAPMSTDGSTVFAPVINSPMVIVSQTQKSEPGRPSGEVVALDAATGAVKWQHDLSTPPFGATTAVNDLVFATAFDGTLSALNTKTGRIVWQVSLPAGTNAGVVVSGDTLLAPAGVPAAEGQTPQLVAYRLGG